MWVQMLTHQALRYSLLLVKFLLVRFATDELKNKAFELVTVVEVVAVAEEIWLPFVTFVSDDLATVDEA